MLPTPQKLGELIKQYRKAAKFSQLELEAMAGMANGSLSRIEGGLVNPTKETIVDIAYALKIDTPEIAALFGINSGGTKNIVSILKQIETAVDFEQQLDLIVNNLIFHLGYIASMVWLVENDQIRAAALTKSNISEAVLGIVGEQFFHLTIPTDSKEGAVAKAFQTSKTQLTHSIYEYSRPSVPKQVADLVQQTAGDKSNLLVPVVKDGLVKLIIVFVKKIQSDFSSEKYILEGIAKQLSTILQV